MMPLELSDTLVRHLQHETIAWLTTVRQDGQPLPTPIWFLWEQERFLIFSEPTALKVRNIQHNPQVALNFNTDITGEIFAVFTGTATLDPHPATTAERIAYVTKYRQGLQMLGVTPAEHAQRWSTVIRFTPTRVRAQLDEPTPIGS